MTETPNIENEHSGSAKFEKEETIKSFADQVTESPAGKLQLMLLEAAEARRFTEEQFNDFLNELAKFSSDPGIPAEIERAKQLTYRDAPPINLSTQGRQLMWAAVLLHTLAQTQQDRVNITGTPFFKHLTNNEIFQQEQLRYAHSLSDHFDRYKTRIRWGAPLSWFYFSPDERLINLDPFHALVFGLPRNPQDYAHSRGPAFHEVAHAVLSKELPEPFQTLLGEVKAYREKYRKGKLSKEEQQDFFDKGVECLLWSNFYNLAEDNVANRFAIVLGRYRYAISYDYSESLKFTYALINKSRKDIEDLRTDAWAKYIKASKEALDKIKGNSAREQFKAIANILGRAVPVNEGLFENTREEWEKAGINWAAFMPSLDSDEKKLEAIKKLLTLGDGRPDSISHQQPYLNRVRRSEEKKGLIKDISAATEKFLNRISLSSETVHSAAEIKKANEERNGIIVAAWKEYVEPLLPEIKRELLKEYSKPNNKQQNNSDNQQDEQDGNGNDSNQPSPGSLGAALPQMPLPPMGEIGTPGNSPQSNSGEETDNDSPEEKDGDLPQDNSGEEESPEQKKDSNASEGADENDQGNDNAQPPRSGKSCGDNDTNDKNSRGNRQEPGTFQNTDKNTDEGQLLSEIIDGDEDKKSQEEKRQNEQQGQLLQTIKNNQQKRVDIKREFPEGNWSNYVEARQKLGWLINIFTAQLDDIRKKQIQHCTRRSRELEILPEGGETDRIDLEAHLLLTSRAEVSAPMRPDDYRRFNKDKKAIEYTTPQIVMLIDGSSSMLGRMNRTSGAAPIDIAISTGIALYEASKLINIRAKAPKPAYESYTGIWGPTQPTWLTLPWTETTEAGKNFDRFRKGLKSYTNLTPAIDMLTTQLSQTAPTRTNVAQTVGATHLLILSDGGIQDSRESREQLEKLIRNVKNLTIDVVVISSTDRSLEHMFYELKDRNPTLNYSLQQIDNIEEIPITCLLALKRRMVKDVIAVPRSQKVFEFKKAAPK